MRRVWDFGNTTVRNPNRLRDGLVILANEFQGKLQGKIAEAKFSKRLSEEGIIKTSGSQPDWFGRKWRSAFVKLGFITNKFRGELVERFKKVENSLGLKGEAYELTPAGKLLIQANSLGAIEDVFLRQLAHLELNSPTEDKYPNGNMKPFIFLLQVIYRLQKEDMEGLNKFEIGVFVIPFKNHTKVVVLETVSKIKKYRAEREKILGSVQRKKFDKEILVKVGQECHIQAYSLIDYADTCVRYSKLSGLVAPNHRRLILRDNKIDAIEALINREVDFLSNSGSDCCGYLENFYKGASLPTDEPLLAHKEIERLISKIKERGREIPFRFRVLQGNEETKTLEQARYDLLDLYVETEEEKFASTQNKFLEDIFEYIDSVQKDRRRIREDIDDPASYLEWAVWRAFLAIDHIVNPLKETRKFPIDQDIRPLNHAPANVPDMIFEFESFILVVEVTLTTSGRQEAMEGEPVRRHVANIALKFPQKQVYALFLAPKIDVNTSETFRRGIWYSGAKGLSVKIVPMDLEQFKLIVSFLVETNSRPSSLLELLDRCLECKEKVNSPVEWVEMIRERTQGWLVK